MAIRLSKASYEGIGALFHWGHYPDRPSRLQPGRRLGLEVAVLDKDPHPDRPAFLTWGPPPRLFKGCDAGSLGELVLGGDREE